MSKAPCEYCGEPCKYGFADGEKVCGQCFDRLPVDAREARHEIVSMNGVVQTQAEQIAMLREALNGILDEILDCSEPSAFEEWYEKGRETLAATEPKE